LSVLESLYGLVRQVLHDASLMFPSRGFPAGTFADGGELKLICCGWGPEEAFCV
jgi:hypothetical protein